MTCTIGDNSGPEAAQGSLAEIPEFLQRPMVFDVSFVVCSTIELFTEWLSYEFLHADSDTREFTVDDGVVAGITWLTMIPPTEPRTLVFGCYGGDAEAKVCVHVSLYRFRFMPLATEKLQVVVQCLDLKAVECLTKLTVRIEQCFPESGGISTHVADFLSKRYGLTPESSVGFNMEDDNGKKLPRVPKRAPDKAKWVATWRFIRSEVERGNTSPQGLLGFLARNPQAAHLATWSEDSMRDIIRAGVAGLLNSR